MVKIAIICEYNPFHCGHLYQINSLRTLYGRDTAIIAIMSGSLTQRGEPSVFSKWSRAKAAVVCGADLVLELPAPWSMSSAALFAAGGVSIAHRLGCIDLLAFGSETADIGALSRAAENMRGDSFKDAVSIARKNNPCIGEAELRRRVYADLYGETPIFGGSNDLLALEYISALSEIGSNIKPIAVKRIGSAYGDTSANTEGDRFLSATAIRELINSGSGISGTVPESAEKIYLDEIKSGDVCRYDRIGRLLCACLSLEDRSRISGWAECGGGVGNLICSLAREKSDIYEIIGDGAGKRYSPSKIRRAVLSILCRYDLKSMKASPLYTSVLAANPTGCSVLSEIRKTSGIHILTKPSDYRKLPVKATEQFEANMRGEILRSILCDTVATPASILKAVPFISKE